RRLGRAHDDVLLLAALGLDGDVAAHLDDVVLGLLVDELGVLDHLLEGHDPALEEGLVVLGLLELGVLAVVPEFHGRVDALRDLVALGRAKVLELGLELLQTIRRDVLGLFKVIHEWPPKKRTEGLAALSTCAGFYASTSSVHAWSPPAQPSEQPFAVVFCRRTRPSMAAHRRPLRDPLVGGDAP